MDDKHDDLDTWLNARVDPMPPPPGTFDLIKRRARRRKYRKLAVTAGAAAVIVAAAVTVPQVVNLNVVNPPQPRARWRARGIGLAAAAPGGRQPSGASQPTLVPRRRRCRPCPRTSGPPRSPSSAPTPAG